MSAGIKCGRDSIAMRLEATATLAIRPSSLSGDRTLERFPESKDRTDRGHKLFVREPKWSRASR